MWASKDLEGQNQEAFSFISKERTDRRRVEGGVDAHDGWVEGGGKGGPGELGRRNWGWVERGPGGWVEGGGV